MNNKSVDLPHSRDAEHMVLGAAISSARDLAVVCEELTYKDFYVRGHALIFSSLRDLYYTNGICELFPLVEEMRLRGTLEDAHGVGYISSLVTLAGIGTDVMEYCKIIKRKSMIRSMILLFREAENTLLNSNEDAPCLLDEFMSKLQSISSISPLRDGKLLKDILDGKHGDKPFIEELRHKAMLHAKGISKDSNSVSTGFYDLDKLLGGLGNSNLVVLAARPAMGKTALALNIASNVALNAKGSVAIFSLEMSAVQLVHRLVSANCGISVQRLIRGDVTQMELDRIETASNRVSTGKIVIDEHSCLSISEIRSRAKRLFLKYNLSLIVIDYLQLISGSRSVRQVENRQNEISEITRLLKGLAVELNIPILVLSQLSRRVEERSNKTPILSDLRDSGAIEQDADCVVFLVRQEVYQPTKMPGEAELIVAKNRHGPTGELRLTFHKTTGAFSSFISKENVNDYR